ncbi:hypothetical protein OG921_13105 [Aldersonia sp. NBC_00410]|uniref:DUF6197 family protein n=1 Tax=Aldersonia sp. NBC_00410 TaxID=2975954 RepID=UPI0022561FD5|nr:hypothetical protein [Aldersonia sp. NBC_00410]MCX5044103.1 hypothetical protein [Aldersonia sp. NBC_00410]
MSVLSAEVMTSTRPESSGADAMSLGWRDRRRLRKRLAEQDRRSAQFAELRTICTVLDKAEAIVRAGWVQHGWFAYRDERDRIAVATAHDLRRMAGRPVVGACMVGAIVQAGGGVPAVWSQPVQRTLDLLWHTLSGSDHPVQWCPAPPVRLARLRELTLWNDRPVRNRGEVLALLGAARAAAARLGTDTTEVARGSLACCPAGGSIDNRPS